MTGLVSTVRRLAAGAIRRLRRLKRRLADPVFVLHRSCVANVYHCCVQRSGSQWISRVLSDPLVYRFSGLDHCYPNVNFIRPEERARLETPFPRGLIVSPFYVRYPDFRAMPKPRPYRGFFVARDPRDLVVSHYFSLRNSHPISSEGMLHWREELKRLGHDEGIARVIERMLPTFIEVLDGWLEAARDADMLIVRYEDLVADGQPATFRKIMNHCSIAIPEVALRRLLDRYGFERLSNGRLRGVEDTGSHYRKGVPGDWQGHLSDEHRRMLKKVAGEAIVAFGYEVDGRW